jgi:two-component system cell cycle sensor histidine kinase/response regulator CckA
VYLQDNRVKDASNSQNKPSILPLQGLARPAAQEEDSFLLPPGPSQTASPSVPKPITLGSKIVHFTSATPGHPSTDLTKLQAELAECRESLEQWTQAEMEWSRQRRLFKVMTENVSDLIALVDRQGHRIWNNPAYSHALGYTTDELAGLYALSEVHPEDQARATEAFNEAVQHGASQQAEYRMQQKDGAWIHLQTEVVPILDANGEIDSIVLLAHDITEQKNLNEALALAATQVSAAGMAEGMARDFDQILTNVQGNLTIAKNLNGPHNAIAVRLNEIERALKRAQDLTEQMLSISSAADQPRQRVALEPIVQEAVSNVLRGTMVRAEYVFPNKLPDLELDVEAFAHAIRNIVTNSLQAMDKGVVRMSAEFLSQEQFSHRSNVPLKPGSYIGLHIQDQGHGIPEKIVPRVFEPYFTTRHGSQGLGLTVALSAIQRQGGTIQIDSTPGVGTTTSIYLPAAAPTSVSASATLPSIALPTQGGAKKRILLMDDEQMILDIVSRMLDHLGYEVKTCLDGSQAIAAFAKAKSQSELFDIVLMDLIIPNGVGGQDAVHTIRKIDPTAKVIASSGHLDHPVMVNYKDYGFAAALEKPYKLEKLQQLIEAVLNS